MTEMKKKPWAGKHLWIWYVHNAEYGEPEKIVDKAVELGLTGIIIKYHDGHIGGDWRDKTVFQRGFRSLVQPLKNAGLTVGAWGYNYMNYPNLESDLIQQAFEDGADWYVFDAESEVELDDVRKHNLEICLETVRTQRPDAVLGYAPFPISQYHPLYPYRIFDRYCDVNMPQVYWKTIGWPLADVWQTMMTGFQQLHLTKPLAPIGQAYDHVSAYEMLEFTRLAKEANMSGISFWSWDSAGPEQFDAIRTIEIVDNKPDELTEAWDFLHRNGIILEKRLEDPATRGEMVLMLYRMIQKGGVFLK